jgi:hypothetical protein
MNFTIDELADLPLACAFLDSDDVAIAQTPEWSGAGPGTVAYPVRNRRLLVATAAATPQTQVLLDRLLTVLEDAALSVAGERRMRMRMLAASLRLIAGRRVITVGTARDVIDFATAGIHSRCQLAVDAARGDDVDVEAPEVAALVLVQLAVNAERHAGADAVTLRQDGKSFHVRWRAAAAPANALTSRRRARRQRWGLGFARIAADTLGGGVFGPRARDGEAEATLELGLRRLALPLAAMRGRTVMRATRTWDEETDSPPGTEVDKGGAVGAAVAAALRRPGRIARTADGFSARTAQSLVWVALPPDDVTERARDVLAGLVHERALTDGVVEPTRSRITALGLLLDAALGSPLPRMPAAAWTRRIHELAQAYGFPLELPRFSGIGAMDPTVVALLAVEAGAGFEVNDGDLWLRIRADRQDDALLTPLAGPGASRIRLS